MNSVTDLFISHELQTGLKVFFRSRLCAGYFRELTYLKNSKEDSPVVPAALICCYGIK